MGFPVAQVADLPLCVAFHICNVNSGYQQRMRLCANSVAVSPEQKCPKIEQEQQTVVAAGSPPVIQQAQPTVIAEGATATADTSELASNDE